MQSFLVSSVVIDASSANCPIDAPLHLTVSYTSAYPELTWQGVYIADVASANWAVPVFGPTQGEIVRNDDEKGASPGTAADTTEAPQTPAAVVHRVVKLQADPRLNASTELIAGGDGLNLGHTGDGDDAVPTFTTLCSRSSAAAPVSHAGTLSLHLDGLGSVFETIPEKYLLQVGILQLSCYTRAAATSPPSAAASPMSRVGEVNIVCQMKKASMHGTAGHPSSCKEEDILSSPLSSLTRCFYSPTA